MKIRVKRMNVGGIASGQSLSILGAGNELGDAWREIETDALTPRARDTFEQQVGRLIHVHEDDLGKLATIAPGLELFEGRLRHPRGQDAKPPIGERHQIAAGKHTATNPEPAPPPGPVYEIPEREMERALTEAKAKRGAQ